jgi:hypothetical protein
MARTYIPQLGLIVRRFLKYMGTYGPTIQQNLGTFAYNAFMFLLDVGEICVSILDAQTPANGSYDPVIVIDSSVYIKQFRGAWEKFLAATDPETED